MIYLASPYSGTPEQQQARFEAAEAYTVKLLKQGFVIFSPIVYAHEMAKRHDLGTSAAYWEGFNHSMIQLVSSIHVLRLDGWEESKGVKAEIALARALDIPVYYTGP